MINTRQILLIFAATLSTLTSAMYKNPGPVVELTASNFKREVLDDKDSMWLVEFYAPWCGHCQKLAPSYELAAKDLKGVVKLGAVNMDEHQSVGAPYDVKGFPTIKFFGNDKQKPTDYQGGRDRDAIRKWCLDTTVSEVNKRTKSKKSDSGSSSSGSGGSKSSSGPATDKDVVVLTDANFASTVFSSKDIWMVEFYAPWCGHCKALEPEWNASASELKGKVKFAKVDATVETGLAQQFGVTGYPSIKVFDYGLPKSQNTAFPYNGQRDQAAISAFAKDLLEKADIEPDLHEIVSSKVYDNNCSGTMICVVAFMPNIYDSDAAERNGYLQTLMKVAKKLRKQPFEFFWTQSGDHLDNERKLNLGFGYPAVIAISPAKSVFATMRGSFSDTNTTDFLNKVLSGSQAVDKLPPLEWRRADKWDGKDAPALEEEPSDDL